MSNVHLITGYAGKEHISSADQGSFNAALFGVGEYVLDRGNQFNANIISNNLIRIYDGDILMQGRHIRLNEDVYVDLEIDNGAQGQQRNDLIVVQYTKNSQTNIESAELIVMKGTPTTGNPNDPEYTSGDIINKNALLNEMPLYRISISGLNIQKLECLFSVIPTQIAREKQISDSINVLNAKTTKHEAAIDTLNTKATNHETAINELNTKTANQETAISGLNTKVTNHETAITTLNEKAANQQTAINTLYARDIYVGSVMLIPECYLTIDEGQNTFTICTQDYYWLEEIFKGITTPDGYRKAYKLSAVVSTNKDGNISIWLNDLLLINTNTWSNSTYRVAVMSEKFHREDIGVELANGYGREGLNLKLQIENKTSDAYAWGVTIHGYFEKI